MAEGIEIRKRTLLINSSTAVLEQVLRLTVLVWLQSYLVQKISPDEFELYKVVAAYMLFVPLVQMAVSGGFARFVTEAYAKRDGERVTQIVSTLTPILLGVATVVLGLGWLVAWNVEYVVTVRPDLPEAQRQELLWDARMMFAILVFMASLRIVLTPFLCGFIVRQKFAWLSTITLTQELLRTAILFGLLFGVSTKVLWVVVATLPPGLLSVLIQVHISRKLVPALRFDRSQIRWPLFSPILSMGGWAVVGRIAITGRTLAAMRSFNLLSASAVPGATWGLASMVENQMYPAILGPLGSLQPVMTTLHATGQEARFRRYYYRFCRYVLWILLFMGLPLLTYRNEIWAFYIPDTIDIYVDVATVMTLLFFKSLVLFPLPMLYQVAIARAEVRPLSLRILVLDGTTIVAAFVAVGVLGFDAVGLAWAFVLVAVVLGPPLYWSLGLKLTGGNWTAFLRRTVLPGLLPATLVAPLYIALHTFLPPSGLLMLGAQCVLGSLAYFGAVLLFCEPSERQDIWRIVGRFRSALGLARG